MCGGDSNTAIVVIDGTYIYIQVRNISPCDELIFYEHYFVEISK